MLKHGVTLPASAVRRICPASRCSLHSAHRSIARGSRFALMAAAATLGTWGLSHAQTTDLDLDGKAAKSKATLAIEQVAAMKAAGVRPGMGVDQFSLGNLDRDQVFTAVAPCRIVDTRIAGGPILAGATRGFDVDGLNFVGQGGQNASCNIPTGVASAVAMTITVTQTVGTGFLTAFRVGSPPPNASVINWNASGQNLANTTIVPVTPGAGTDFAVLAGGSSTQVVIDVVGYFAAPEATALQCINPFVLNQIPLGGFTQTILCPAGYTVTGGFTTFPLTVNFWERGQISADGNGWQSTMVNNTGVSGLFAVTTARCCRVPGR